MCIVELIFEKIFKAYKFHWIEKVLVFLVKVPASHGNVLEFYIK